MQVTTVRTFFAGHPGFDPANDLQSLDWLIIPQQALLELTADMVFHDGLGDLRDLTALRTRLAYYPRDFWLYLMATHRPMGALRRHGRCG